MRMQSRSTLPSPSQDNPMSEPHFADGMATPYLLGVTITLGCLLFTIPNSRAVDQNYTMDNIVAALEAAEAQAPVLKFEYSYERATQYNKNGSVQVKTHIEARFA